MEETVHPSSRAAVLVLWPNTLPRHCCGFPMMCHPSVYLVQPGLISVCLGITSALVSPQNVLLIKKQGGNYLCLPAGTGPSGAVSPHLNSHWTPNAVISPSRSVKASGEPHSILLS